MAVVKCIKVSWHSITVLRNTFLLVLAGKTSTYSVLWRFGG